MIMDPRPKTLVIIPQCGIGDLIQYMPLLRALARRSLGGKISLYIKSRSMAKQWFAHDPCLDTLEYLERRDLYEKALHLRGQKFQEAWIFHKSFSHTLLAWAAGIPKRYAPGKGYQKILSTNPPIAKEKLQGLIRDMCWGLFHQQGIFPQEGDDKLIIHQDAMKVIQDAYPSLPRPLIALGTGASEIHKKWPADPFKELAKRLCSQYPVTFLLIGSKQDEAFHHDLAGEFDRSGIPYIRATQWSIDKSFALLSRAHLYIGNDTSLLNASATLGIPAVGLFGATPVLDFSPHIWPVYPHEHTPENRRGMEAITPDHVMKVLEHHQWQGYLKGA